MIAIIVVWRRQESRPRVVASILHRIDDQVAVPQSIIRATRDLVLVRSAFRKATPYNEAFYQSMQMVKDFWATPEYAELLTQMNQRLYPFVVGGKGTAEEALNGVASDWDATFKKYKRY